MSISGEFKNIDVVLLCGGLGKRLWPVVNDRPKPLAEINNRAFLDILIDYAAHFGFRRFILCTGYLGNMFKLYYQNKRFSFPILFSEEDEPLGTAGAIKHAELFIQSSPFLIMNGDSFCRVDLRKFFNFHLHKSALLSMVLIKMKEVREFGTVILGDSQRIIGFNEKSGLRKQIFINAGIYIFQREVLSSIPANQKISLETDFFPQVVNQQFYGYIAQKKFIDIGTPERYLEAKKALGA